MIGQLCPPKIESDVGLLKSDSKISLQLAVTSAWVGLTCELPPSTTVELCEGNYSHQEGYTRKQIPELDGTWRTTAEAKEATLSLHCPRLLLYSLQPLVPVFQS